MRLTLTLHKIPIQWLLRLEWIRKSQYVRHLPKIPPYLHAKGIPIVDAREEYVNPRKFYKKWYPPVPDDPRWAPIPSPTTRPDWNDEAVYEFNKDCRLLLGLKQAVNLTKSHLIHGLPQTVEDLRGAVSIPDQDELVQRFIMQAYKWDPTKEKLPKRKNPDLPIWKFKAETGIPKRRSIHILLQNLLRLSQTLGATHNDLLHGRRHIQNNYTSTSYSFRDYKPIHLRFNSDWLITSQRPLAPFVGETEVDNTVLQELPDLYPIAPTIDLEQQHLYNIENITGVKEKHTHGHPHTLIINSDSDWSADELNTRALLYCFGQATAQAKRMYGWDVKALPQPIAVQCISSQGPQFHFLCLQLNTLDLKSTSGVKNVAWIDANNYLFQQLVPKRSMLRNTKYEDYDPAVYNKFLAMYLNGAHLNNL